MRLTNHIALRFLQDDKIWAEIVEETHPEPFKKFGLALIQNKDLPESDENQAKIISLWRLVENRKNPGRTFLVTDSVHDKLDMLKLHRDKENHYDWTIFKHLKDFKASFILTPSTYWDRGGVLRVLVQDKYINFFYIHARKKEDIDNEMWMHWTMFYLNRFDNTHPEYCEHQDVKDIYEFVYKLLCFVYLSENEYQEVLGGRSAGTRKNGKFKNDLTIPVTLITSKWNVTSVRTEGFQVAAHFRLQPCGAGGSQTKMILIEPFEKHGYVRRAKNESL